MASKRIKKKTAKANTIHAIRIEQLKLQKIEVEVEMLDVRIQQAQLKLKTKQRTLESLQRQLSDIQFIIIEAEAKTKILRGDLTSNQVGNIVKDVKEKGGWDYNNAEKYVAIKRYEELVAQGILKRESSFDKYDAVEYMHQILGENELNKLILEGEKKREELYAKHMAAHEQFMKNIIQF